MRNYSTADPEHNTYALAIADAIGRHTDAARQAALEGREPEPTAIEIPGGGRWALSRSRVAPRWVVARDGDDKAFRFADGVDAVAAVMRACDTERPLALLLTDAGEEEARVIAHA
ncbi:MAG: hypothetical protein REI11_14690 [Patulibacter sp.]|nr:hypothetical protein [Patulibacter sp.]